MAGVSGGRTGESAHDTVQSEKPRGEYRSPSLTYTVRLHLQAVERDWKDRAAGSAAIVLDVAKGAAEAFGPLKAVLEIVSAVYNQYKVCPLPSIGNLTLKRLSSGNYRR